MTSLPLFFRVSCLFFLISPPVGGGSSSSYFIFLADGLVDRFKLLYFEALAETDHQREVKGLLVGVFFEAYKILKVEVLLSFLMKYQI